MGMATTRDAWRDLLALPALDLSALDADALHGGVRVVPVDVPKRTAGHVADAAHVWRVLDGVLDPEVPVVSIRELGIVREVQCEGEHVAVVLTPTYSGCPATEMIEANVRDALDNAGYESVTVSYRRAPAWTSDWITDEGRRKLREYGIAPPAKVACDACAARALPRVASDIPVRFVERDPVDAATVACPRCGSAQTERVSAFGSTACKSLYRCIACREPFEYFKPI